MSELPFWERGYAVARDLLGAGQLAFTRAAMDASQTGDQMYHDTEVVPQGALNEYSPIGAELLLLQARPAIEALVGRALLPAYGFWRIYPSGSELTRHIDRNACEVSATLPIFADPADEAWPIHVRDLAGKTTSVALTPGEALVYQGCRVPHWREPLSGRVQYQVFLHYVLADGDRADHALDGRNALNIDLARRAG